MKKISITTKQITFLLAILLSFSSIIAQEITSNEVINNVHNQPSVLNQGFNYYGSGDVNNDNIRDENDIILGSTLDEADIDGDGNPGTLIDASTFSNYLTGGIANLPSDWNILPREGKVSWLEKMLEVDKTDENPYVAGSYDCNGFSYETLLNFFGNLNAEENLGAGSTITTENNARFNLPVYEVSTTTTNGGGHAINGILVGDNPLNFKDWYFFEPQTDGKVVPGNLSMDPNSPVEIVWYGKATDRGYTRFGTSKVIFFNLENGEANQIDYLNPLIPRVNPNKVELKLNPLEKMLVNENISPESLNLDSSAIETSLDLNETFYHLNKGVGNNGELNGVYIVRRTDTFSDKIPLDSENPEDNYKIIRTEKVELIQRTELTDPYGKSNHDVILKTDSTNQEIEFRIPHSTIKLGDLNGILVNYQKGMDTSPEALVQMGHDAFPTVKTTGPDSAYTLTHKDGEKVALSNEFPEVNNWYKRTFIGTLNKNGTADTTEHVITTADLEDPKISQLEDIVISKSDSLHPSITGYPARTDNHAIKDSTISYKLISADESKEVYHAFATAEDFSGNKAKDSSGNTEVKYQKVTRDLTTGIKDIAELPIEFSLSQNYPNPFNPSTTISYSIPVETRRGVLSQTVTLTVYTILGKKVATLVNENKPAGRYTVNFDASNLSSGIYVYRIKTESFSQSKKMLLLR